MSFYKSILYSIISTLTLALSSCGGNPSFTGLTNQQVGNISSYIVNIKSLGFTTIRLLSYSNPNVPKLNTWPKQRFLSFPQPTQAELNNLAEFISLVKAFGLKFEMVIVCSDDTGNYYTNGVTSADYHTFIDALMTVLKPTDRIYIGGDLVLSPPFIMSRVTTNQQWISDVFPYVKHKYPTYKFGIEVITAYTSLYDQGVASATWANTNLNPKPDFYGFQFYPSSHNNVPMKPDNTIDWAAMTNDWVAHIKSLNVTAFVDEIGLQSDGPVGQTTSFTQQEQSDFLTTAIPILAQANMPANIWELDDHLKIGTFGLYTQDHKSKLVINNLPNAIKTSNTGVAFEPGNTVGLDWLMPSQ